MEQAVKDFQQAVLTLYDAVMEYADRAEDPNEVARHLISMVDAKRDLGWIQTELQALFVKLMGDRTELIVDGRTVEKKQGATRKTWQHDKIAATVLSRLRDLSIDEDTGEVTLTPEEAIEGIMKFGHIDYWRVTDLRELDINADLYCEVKEGDPSVIVRKAK